MDTDEAVATPEPDVSAAVEESTPEASEQSSSSAEPTSMESALAEARAELASEESDTAKGEDANASPKPPATVDSEVTPQQPAETVSERKVTSQGELDRIQTLIAQGREAELDPAARGVLRKLEERVLAGQEKEAGFRKLYLDFEAERLDDVDAFTDKVLDDPAIAQFMRSYKAAHPGISLETPDAQPKQPNPQEVRAQVDAEYSDAVQQVASELCQKAGLDEVKIARLQAESGGKVGELLIRSFEAAVEARAEQMRPEIVRKEREAAELEAQAKYANKTIITPRAIGGVPVQGGKRDPSEPFNMGDAMREARAELEAAGV